jgi:hypothetical protein
MSVAVVVAAEVVAFDGSGSIRHRPHNNQWHSERMAK